MGTAPSSEGSSTTDFRVLGDLVFRMEFCFLRKDGTNSNTSAVNSIPTTDLLRDVSGIVVAIAVMDEEGRKMSSSLSSLIASLPDAAESDLTAASPRFMSTV
ncbi:MAG TPA: hypothetical protein VK970_10845 [Candidatus Methylacidiphilales bacterium]|nr:hypothetical protein [Candidatus Methylacidiphilales bacterium]